MIGIERPCDLDLGQITYIDEAGAVARYGDELLLLTEREADVWTARLEGR